MQELASPAMVLAFQTAWEDGHGFWNQTFAPIMLSSELCLDVFGATFCGPVQHLKHWGRLVMCRGL